MTLGTESLMHGIAVAVLTEDREQSVILNTRVESTHVARTVLSHVGFPAGPGDAVLRHLQDQHAEVVLVDRSGAQKRRKRSSQASTSRRGSGLTA